MDTAIFVLVSILALAALAWLAWMARRMFPALGDFLTALIWHRII